MSDLAAAILILPALTALVIVLEGSRAGCNHILRLWRTGSPRDCEEAVEAPSPHHA